MVNIRRIEDEVIGALVDGLLEEKYVLSVFYGDENGDDSDYGVIKSTDKAAIMAALHACDEEWLFVYKPGVPKDDNFPPFGWVHFVYGNDGWDVISNNTVNLEDTKGMIAAQAVSDRWS